jgi:hypothetical protein
MEGEGTCEKASGEEVLTAVLGDEPTQAHRLQRSYSDDGGKPQENNPVSGKKSQTERACTNESLDKVESDGRKPTRIFTTAWSCVNVRGPVEHFLTQNVRACVQRQQRILHRRSHEN